MKRRTTWKHGDKTRLADAAGIPPSFLVDILAGRKACPARVALLLAEAAEDLGYRIPPSDWVWPEQFPNPLIPHTARP